MSFASEVKDELDAIIPEARHCQIAELAAIFDMCGQIVVKKNCRIVTGIQTENITIARKYFTLLKKSFNIVGDVSVRHNVKQQKSSIYIVKVSDDGDSRKILSAMKRMNYDGTLMEVGPARDRMLLQNSCCRRAYIRGSFLVSGSVSDPSNSYHFEITCFGEGKAMQLQLLLLSFDIDAKIVIRKNHHVVYVKDGSQIVDVLNVMEAHQALMEMENIRIAKEIRNSVNRQVNCEMANIHKTVSAATKQVEDIQYIRNTVGFGDLSDALKEMALVRINHPEASLIELGKLLSNPVGKSGVNHRLRKLSQIADELREKNKDD